MVLIMQNTQEKADLQKTKVNAMKIRKTEINFVLGKNGGYMPNSFSGSLIFVVRQAGGQAGGRAGGQAGRQNKYLQFTKFLTFDNLNSKVLFGYLNGFVYICISIV